MRLSEDALIATYFSPLAGEGALGLGDDAAFLTPQPGYDLVLTKDMLVAGVHFFPDDAPQTIARKLMRVNLSDLAAKGAEPCGFLLGLALPEGWTSDWLGDFARGLGDDATQFHFPLLGGDTVRTPGPLTLSLTALGRVPSGAMVRRHGARPGDRLYVTGTIGDAALGLLLRLHRAEDLAWTDALPAEKCTSLLRRYLVPEPRCGLAPVLRAHARAAMDISDGLAGDLAKFLQTGVPGASGSTTARVDLAAIPLSEAARAVLSLAPERIDTIVTGGDDYEILCAVAPEQCADFERAARDHQVPDCKVNVTAIGIVETGQGLPRFFSADGMVRTFPKGSFQHF